VSALGPIGGLVGGLLGGWASDQLGGNFNIGGTDNRIGAGLGIGGSQGGWGSGAPGPGNPGGQNGAGQHDGRRLGAPPTWPGRSPAPAAPPAGLPPAANPTLANLSYAGMTADPFAGRFGISPGLLAYVIAANQPQGNGFLSGNAP